MIEDLRQKILQSRLKMHVNDETHQCINTLWYILLAQKDELTASNRKLYIIPSNLSKSGYDNCSFKKNCDGSGSVICSTSSLT